MVILPGLFVVDGFMGGLSGEELFGWLIVEGIFQGGVFWVAAL